MNHTKFSYFLMAILLSMFACKTIQKNQQTNNTENNDYTWQQNDKMLALLRHDTIIWQLNYDRTQDKPYFHPLRTPQGYDLTLERPTDHPWHRGLWFSWKDINGINYWEEDPKKGIAEGRSIINSVHVKTNKDFSAKVTINISYEENSSPTIIENRVLNISSPSGQDNYTISWDQTFTAQKDIRLYLEKPAKHGGVQWGGYAGLSFRAAASLTDHQFLASNGWTNTNDLTGYGEKAAWMDLTAKVKGTQQEYAGLTIFDHPQNPRHPSPWYIWFAAGQHAFFTPSLLFDEPMHLKTGERFSLKYLTLIHDHKKTNTQLDQQYKKYIK